MEQRLANWKKARISPNATKESLEPIILTVNYFQRDVAAESIMKDGIRGKFQQISGVLGNVDRIQGTLTVAGCAIAFDDIYSISSS